MLFTLAHSLGFPHYEQMLDTMTARQYGELLSYLKHRGKKKESARIQDQESNLKAWFSRKLKRQQEAKNAC